MKRHLPIIVAGFVTLILALLYLPIFIVYLIGYFQIGYWIGTFIIKKISQDET